MVRAAAAVLLCAAALCAQPAPVPRFEVASIKPTPADGYNGSSGIPAGNGQLRGDHVTLKRCIMGAFGIGPRQIAGGPPWLDTDRFEIAAKADRPVGATALMAMLQTLLAERFHLEFHRETRTLEALVLAVSKGGVKLQKAAGGGARTSSSRGRIEARSISMPRLAEVLSRQMEEPVVDGAALEGSFDLTLEWSPDSDKPVKPGETAPPDAGPSLFTALQQQLGLRLQSRKTPIEVLVIDRAEKPSPN